MAYTFFPETSTEIKKTLKGDKAKIEDIISVFAYIKQNFPKIKTPINIDPQSIGKINISRSLVGDIDLANIKLKAKANKITMKFGDGSSGGRGVKNVGNAFEGIFAQEIRNWWAGEPVEIKALQAIEKIDELHKLTKCKTLEVKEVGELNNKRPFVFTPTVHIGSQISVQNNNLGPIVTDVTLECAKSKSQPTEIYLSLKTGGTVTFFNSGIKTVLTSTEIKSGLIKNENGLKILDMFNINNAVFCDIFNGKLKEGYSENIWSTMSAKQKANLKTFLKSGIGHGYTIVHKLNSGIKVYEIDETYMNEAATPSSCTIYYGGKTGTGKRIDMEVETKHYILKLNIRDTQGGDGYPTRMMCDYSYK